MFPIDLALLQKLFPLEIINNDDQFWLISSISIDGNLYKTLYDFKSVKD